MRVVNKSLMSIAIIFIIFSLFLIPLTVKAYTSPKGSKIANIAVEKLNKEQIKQKLKTETTLWQQGEDLILKSDYEKFIIPRSSFQFQLHKTVEQLYEQTKRHYHNFFLGKRNVHIPLTVTVDEANKAITDLRQVSYVNFEATMEHIIDRVSELKDEEIPIVYTNEAEIEQAKIAEQELAVPESMSKAVLSYVVKEIDGQIISPNDRFSFIESIKLPDKLTKSPDELSFVATALYALILQTNFDIVVKQSPLRQQAYVDKGIDVYVHPDRQVDFIINNPNEFSYKIEAELKDERLKMTLHSYPLERNYEYMLDEVKKIKKRTIYRYSKSLNPGESDLIDEGKDGYIVDVYRNILDKNGSFIDSEFISREFSLPMPRIVLVSPQEEVEDKEVDDNDIIEDIIEDEQYYFDDINMEIFDELVEIETKRVQESIKEMLDSYFDTFNESMVENIDDYLEQTFEIIDFFEQIDEFETEEERDEAIERLKDSLADIENPVYKHYLQSYFEKWLERTIGKEG